MGDYAERMKKFLKVYDVTTMGKKPDGTDYPVFDVETRLGKECGVAPYGYVASAGKKVAPCIFVKLSAIWGWTPEPYECLTPEENPDCPATLRAHLGSQEARDAGPNNVWIDCNGPMLLTRRLWKAESSTSPRDATFLLNISLIMVKRRTRREILWRPIILPWWPSRWTPRTRVRWSTSSAEHITTG